MKDLGSQKLNAAGTSQSSLSFLGLGQWTSYNNGSAKWHVGNIKTCADLGMRLPTIFETRVANHTSDSTHPTNDGFPEFGGSGVPSSDKGFTWTSTSIRVNSNSYWKWSGYTGYSGYNGFEDYNGIRCVLP